MSQDILRIAQDCGLIGMRPHLDGIYEEALVKFAAAISEAKKEECARICDDLIGTRAMAKHCADAIRARGQA